MKVSNGNTSFELERNKNLFQVRLESTQVKEAAIKELSEKIEVEEKEDAWLLTYHVSENAQSLATMIQRTASRCDKLKLAQKLSSLTSLENQFRVPFLHPENILFEGEQLFVVHFGLKKLLAPVEMTTDEFLKSYKALIFNIFNSKNSFDALLAGAHTSNDKFIQAVNNCETVPEVTQLINQEAKKESDKVAQKLALVPKGRYRFFMYSGIVSIVVAIVLAAFTLSFYSNNKKQEAIITAQTNFLTANYAQVQTDLVDYSASELPKSARYILAVSSVNLSNLSLAQKQAILNNISTKSDDNTLNYWLYTGRGDFDKALDLAQNLGDNQLTLLAYTNLYESTKLNTTMDGAKKQELLEEYNKKIQELTESLGI